jgi:transposase
MIVLGADMHKSSHTLAAVAAATGEMLDEKTAAVGARGFDAVLQWARGLGPDRVWALEDCRHVSGSFERFLIARGERVVRVPTRLMANTRRASRERGKSDRIDALAVARAALAEGIGTLPTAELAGPELDIRLLVDHRERLVRARVGLNNTLQWHLHDLWPELVLPGSSLFYGTWGPRIARRLARAEQTMRVRIARDELRRLRELTQAINALETEIAALVAQVAPQLLAEPGFGPLTAAKLVGEIAGAARFSSDAKLARAAGLAPIPVSSCRTDRHRLDRGGNRQIKRRHPPCRGHPRALSPRNDRVPGAQEDRRQDAPRGRPLAQAPPRPPHLAAATRAPPGLRNTAPPINFLTKEQQTQQRRWPARWLPQCTSSNSDVPCDSLRGDAGGEQLTLFVRQSGAGASAPDSGTRASQRSTPRGPQEHRLRARSPLHCSTSRHPPPSQGSTQRRSRPIVDTASVHRVTDARR